MSPKIPAEDTFILAIYLNEVPHHELWKRGRPYIRQGYAPNSMRLVNLAEEFSALIASPHETLAFYIPRASLDEITDEAGVPRVSDLTCTPGLVDPVIANLTAALLPAFDRPEQASPLFTEHLSLAVCWHLIKNYAESSYNGPNTATGLTPSQANRAKAIMAGIGGRDVGLTEVARECGLSRGYFTKAFKARTGLTPHQWRQRYRIDRAKTLLLETKFDVAEIALECGFADQSHLTRVFARMVGDSPASWRRRRRN
jgi:AraC-like DNA-binding protein